VVYHQLSHIIDPSTFQPRCNLLRQLLYHSIRKSIRLYIAIFIRCLFNLLTGLYIVASLAALSVVTLSCYPSLYYTPFSQPPS